MLTPRSPCYDPHMARDWSRAAWHDEVAVDPRLARIAHAGSVVADSLDAPSRIVGGRIALIQLGLASECLLVGLMTTALYVWPTLFVTHILTGGFRLGLVWAILGTSVAFVSVVAWLITRLEARYWPRHLDDLPDSADPPAWR